MNRFGTAITLICIVLGLVFTPIPFHSARAQEATVPITPENATEVVELARFGRGELQAVGWSPDGSQLLVASAAGVWLYNAADLSAAPILLPGTTAIIRNVVFNSAGTQIVAGDVSGTVHVWDAVTHEKKLTLNQEGNFNTARAAFSPDGRQIIMSVGDNLLVRDAATGEVLLELEDAHTSTIMGVVYSPDGSLILSYGNDKVARLWDATTLTAIAMMEGHTSYVNAAAFTPDGALIVTVGNDKMTRLWDGKTGEEVAVYEQERGNVYGVDFDPTGSMIATGSSYGDIRLFDTASLDEPVVWEKVHNSEVLKVAFSPDGTRLASVSKDQVVKLWDVATGEEVDSAPGHTRSISNVALNAEGTLILAGSYDGRLRAWSITGDDAHPVFMQENAVYNSTDNLVTAAVSPNGTQFASCVGSKLLAWNVATQEPLYQIDDYTLGSFRSMTYSPDSALIAITTTKGKLVLWDASTGDQLAVLDGHSENVTPVVFNADNSLVITGGADGTVRLWGLPATAAALGISSGSSAAVDTKPENSSTMPDSTSAPDTDAQAEPSIFVAADDLFSFAYPSEWALREDSSTAVVIAPDETGFDKQLDDFVAGQDIKIGVNWGPIETMISSNYDPSFVDFVPESDIALEWFFSYFPTVFNWGDSQDLTMGDAKVGRFDGTDGDMYFLVMALRLNDGIIVSVSSTFLIADQALFEPVVVNLVGSIIGESPSTAVAAIAEAPPTPESNAEGPTFPIPPSIDELASITGPDDCHNVAVGIADFSSQYSADYAPENLLDGDPAKGWSSAGSEATPYIVFNLDGMQTVGSVLFNSYSPSAGYELDSVKDFRIDVPDGMSGTPVFTGQAALTQGFQVYTFTPVTANQLRFTFTSNHGGDYFEAAEIMICAAGGNTQSTTGGETLRQWAARATATSQFTDTDWSAAQATGAPNTTACGDIGTAWASAAADGVDTLTVYFDTPVVPQQVNIYQTYTPGSITGITLLKGTEEFSVPNSADPGTDCPGVFSVVIPPDLTQGGTIDGVRIELDQRTLYNWNEIDAVELVGTR